MRRMIWWLLILVLLIAPTASADPIDEWLQSIARVGPQGAGSIEAAKARAELAQLAALHLPRILPALKTNNVVAANWYRSVVDTIVANEMKKTTPVWPIDDLKAFIRRPSETANSADQENNLEDIGYGKARRLVLNLIERIEPGFRDSWIPQQLNDPEFRHDAVEAALAAGERAKRETNLELARRQFNQAFLNARESDQVLRASRQLKELGQDVNPIRHLGFIHRWRLLGPFDAPGFSGFDQTFPPELAANKLDTSVTYQGSAGQTIGWKLYASRDPLGQLDLITAIGAAREAVGYAYCEIESPAEQRVQIRCSADDNLSVWLNGAKILAQRQWLNGTRLDRFSVNAKLHRGPNTILVKICQGPQHVNPEVPNNWSFQLRLCDSTGAGIQFENQLPSPPGSVPAVPER